MNWSEQVANLIAAVNEEHVTDNQRAQYEAMMAFSRKSIVAASDYIAPTEDGAA